MYSEIVERAYNNGITDIGQLSKEELKDLKKAVKDGYLTTIIYYGYPTPKKRYVCNWGDFYRRVEEYK